MLKLQETKTCLKLPGQQKRRRNLHKAREILRIWFPAIEQPALVLHPGEEPFDDPAPLVATTRSARASSNYLYGVRTGLLIRTTKPLHRPVETAAKSGHQKDLPAIFTEASRCSSHLSRWIRLGLADMRLVSSLALFAVLVAGKASAVEGGLGRSITGLQATNYSGVVPPDPGWSLAFGYAYYSGDIGTERELPISGVTALGLSATFDLFSLTGMYVWDTGEGRWNFASMVTVPVANVDVGEGLIVGPIQCSVDDSVHGKLYDMSFAPLIAGYHFDETRHLSLALYVSAPTGSFDPDRLANPSLNAWVYTPTVAYTQLAQKGSLEWTTVVGIDFSSWNHDTNYRSGAILHLDSLLVKSFANGWGVGGSGGWIEQIEDDSGALADRLDGFRGSALALGPIVTYQGKWAGNTVVFSARWLKEFNVKRRLEGDPLMVTASITF